MKRIALLFCSTLFAIEPLDLPKSDLLKSAPMEMAFPKVDIMTGTYIEDALDLVVAGNDPLSIRRFYYHTAPKHDTRYGFWHFNPESNITANLEFGALPLFASVGQFSGGMIQCNRLGDAKYGLTKNSSPSYIAPATYISRDLCHSVQHYVAKRWYRDFVPRIDVMGRIKHRAITQYVPSNPAAGFFDHSSGSPTYEPFTRQEIRNYLTSTGK